MTWWCKTVRITSIISKLLGDPDQIDALHRTEISLADEWRIQNEFKTWCYLGTNGQNKVSHELRISPIREIHWTLQKGTPRIQISYWRQRVVRAWPFRRQDASFANRQANYDPFRGLYPFHVHDLHHVHVPVREQLLPFCGPSAWVRHQRAECPMGEHQEEQSIE